MPLKIIDFESPRQLARQMMRNSISKKQLKENEKFLDQLIPEIKQHPFTKNPALQAMSQGIFDRKSVLEFHLDFRYAVVSVFTDIIVLAQFYTRNLERRLGLEGKMAPRFLLTLNLLDEFGFRPGESKENQYFRGHPEASHPLLFDQVIKELGATPSIEKNFQPSQIAKIIRQYYESYFNNFMGLLALIGVTEEEAMVYSPPMRKASEAVGIDVNHGYYMVHGTTEDDDLNAADDYHQHDIWEILIQSMQAKDYQLVRQISLDTGNLWNQFWSYQLTRAQLRKENKKEQKDILTAHNTKRTEHEIRLH